MNAVRLVIPEGHALEVRYLCEPVALLETAGDSLIVRELRPLPDGLRAHIYTLAAPALRSRPRLRLVS